MWRLWLQVEVHSDSIRICTVMGKCVFLFLGRGMEMQERVGIRITRLYCKCLYRYSHLWWWMNHISMNRAMKVRWERLKGTKCLDNITRLYVLFDYYSFLLPFSYNIYLSSLSLSYSIFILLLYSNLLSSLSLYHLISSYIILYLLISSYISLYHLLSVITAHSEVSDVGTDCSSEGESIRIFWSDSESLCSEEGWYSEESGGMEEWYREPKWKVRSAEQLAILAVEDSDLELYWS